MKVIMHDGSVQELSFEDEAKEKNENERSYFLMSEVETKVEEVKTTTAKKKRMSVKDLTTLGLLTGILLVMAFTPLGYFHTLGVDISLMMIPVGIGAMLMGPKAGAWLGFIFGATSFYQALTGTSVFSATLFNISPVNTFLLCIPTRMLMGFLTGVIFMVVSKLDKKKELPSIFL